HVADVIAGAVERGDDQRIGGHGTLQLLDLARGAEDLRHLPAGLRTEPDRHDLHVGSAGPGPRVHRGLRGQLQHAAAVAQRAADLEIVADAADEGATAAVAVAATTVAGAVAAAIAAAEQIVEAGSG